MMPNNYRFYLGSAHKYFPEWGYNMEGVAHFVLTKYNIQGYTVLRAKGLWQGEIEDVLVYDIFTSASLDLIKTIVNELIDMTGETAILLATSNSLSYLCPCPYSQIGEDTLPGSLKF